MTANRLGIIKDFEDVDFSYVYKKKSRLVYESECSLKFICIGDAFAGCLTGRIEYENVLKKNYYE